MDPFHEQLARIAMDAAGSFGFALAAGYAVHTYGFLNRRSSDVDAVGNRRGGFTVVSASGRVVPSPVVACPLADGPCAGCRLGPAGREETRAGLA